MRGAALFALAALLLSGSSLEEEASALPYGRWRDAMLRVARPLGRAARLTRASDFRKAVSGSAGRWLNGSRKGGVEK